MRTRQRHDAGRSRLFAGLDARFALLACEPDPIGLDCTIFDPALGLPDGFVALPVLRSWLLTHPRAGAAADAVWRELIGRARDGAADWVVAAVWMALPGLVNHAGSLARGFHGDVADIEQAMLAAFLTLLKRDLDVDRGRLCSRLCRGAYRAGLAARHADAAYVLLADADRLAGAPPRLPYGHPDLIVGRAVRRGVIDPVDAELILVTRLQRVPLSTVAGWLDTDVQGLRLRRRRAEHALVDALEAGLLSARVSPDTARQLAHRHRRRRTTLPRQDDAAGRTGAG
jgi:hypothetical protein